VSRQPRGSVGAPPCAEPREWLAVKNSVATGILRNLPVVFGKRFALSAPRHFLSLSSSKKEERAGERRRFLSISPLSDSYSGRQDAALYGSQDGCHHVWGRTPNPHFDRRHSNQ